MPSLRRSTEDVDPLTLAIAPPANESPVERAARLASEKAAKEVSDRIDEEILAAQRNADKKDVVRVLLLGQSESGKSTTLKNFQLINSPKAFRAEKASWRAVVQLNVARSIRIILDAMSLAQQQQSSPLSPTSPVLSIDSRSSSPTPEPDLPMLTPELLKLKMRLSPLLQVENSLWSRFSPEDGAQMHLASITNTPITRTKEAYVHSALAWKSAFSRLMSSSTSRSSVDSEQGIDWDDPKDPGVILHNSADDMKTLWQDTTIRALLDALRLRLEDMPGFFLDDIDRVTALKYVPSDEDVLKARLKTIGITEHRFVLKAAGNLVSRDWRIYDVGGARSLVRGSMNTNQLDTDSHSAAWAPYFENIDAIIFLAPLSCFDQTLAEDPMVNRLEDSILLWRSIVSNQLLKQTQLILFLNKSDILDAKLKSGIQFSKWVISYGDRPNSFDAVTKYMKKKFSMICKQNSPVERVFHCHCTSVTDSRTTFQILENVKDTIIRKSLADSHII
ncbi:G-protein alpha subunit [Gymnopus androsaceus JB14]|uniref:G-protein alpha subunit n=1 Tax=Gymnopus androsaceus JB14 TaxID=1447944 RepID=A0A6A4IDE3_9AGAR|nr:G-protein alpha subunit [Gymnopus androsaceus JB14]